MEKYNKLLRYLIELVEKGLLTSKDLKREVPIKGIIFEYDGDKHYYSMMKIESDNIKMKELARLRYRRIRIPLYYQLTIDIAKFIFDDLMFHYSGKKYFKK